MNRQGILKQLFACYPNTSIEPETVIMYDDLLSDIPDVLLQDAVKQAISRSEFLPTVAKLRETARNLAQPKRMTWVEAWDNVQQQMRKVGYIGTPTFSSDITAQVVKSMGWRQLCGSDNPDIVRAHFRDMYTALANRHDDEEML